MLSFNILLMLFTFLDEVFLYSYKIDKLNETHTFKSSDGQFRFKLCYQNLMEKWVCHEWKQASNPVEEQEVQGYEEINTESSFYFENFGGLQKAVQNPDITLIEETNSGAFWVGVFEKMGWGIYMGPPNKLGGGLLYWEMDLMRFSVYRKIEGESHIKGDDC